MAGRWHYKLLVSLKFTKFTTRRHAILWVDGGATNLVSLKLTKLTEHKNTSLWVDVEQQTCSVFEVYKVYNTK